MRLDIAGIQIDNVTTSEALGQIRGFVSSGQPHLVTTVYSEFIVEAQKNENFRQVLNSSHLSLPDGIGIVWAAKFLSFPKLGGVVTCLVWLWSLCMIILAPKRLRSVIPGQVTGSRLIWDIAQMASQEGFSLALVGGLDGVAEKTAARLTGEFPGLKINLAVSSQPFDQAMATRIASSNSDILMIAYQPPRQEIWLAENLSRLNVKAAMGLGGTFDYVAGRRSPAPTWMHRMGLEWLWRLLTQPHRAGRMWRALPVFATIILKRKLNS